MKFCLIQSGTVQNVIIADTLDIAQAIALTCDCDTTIGVANDFFVGLGFTYDGTAFTAPVEEG